MSAKRTVALLASLALAGCEGALDGYGTPVDAGGRPDWFVCRADAAPSIDSVQRLTPTQYRNAVEDVLLRAFDEGQVAGVLSSGDIGDQLRALPTDGHGHRAEITYDTMDQRISPLLVTPQFEVAAGLGDWVARNTGRRETFVRAYAGETACAALDGDGCVNAFIDALGLVTLRRPLDDDDRAHYRAVYDEAGEWGGYRGLITSLLMAPGFIFRAEFRGEPFEEHADVTRLTPYETAQRLAFALTNAPPDAELLVAAAAGFEGEGQTLDEQVTRLLATPRAHAHMQQFFRQWLRLDRVSGINPTAAMALTLQYPDESAPALPTNTDLVQLRLDAFEELVELMTWYYARGGSLSDAVMSDVSFARSDALATVYGVTPWSGDEEALVHFPPGQRAGLFTRAGYLISGYPDTNPVMRGARLRVEYLCDAMEPPADISPPANYQPPEVPTVRNTVVARTEISGSGCQSCHQLSINPLGFPFETYDALGRFRTQEPLFDGFGAVTSWVPVNATTMPSINRNGASDQVNNGVELSALLANSQRLQACYARHVFRYLKGRHEELKGAEDGCVLGSMERAAGTGSLQDVVRAVTAHESFTLRRTTGESSP